MSKSLDELQSENDYLRQHVGNLEEQLKLAKQAIELMEQRMVQAEKKARQKLRDVAAKIGTAPNPNNMPTPAIKRSKTFDDALQRNMELTQKSKILKPGANA